MTVQKINKVLIANRGVVVARLIRTLRKMNIKVVVIYSEADKDLGYIKLADEAYYVGEAPALKSYLNQDEIIKIARQAQVDAIHPGYGFLSENPEFAEKVVTNGMLFIGPSYKWLRDLGHKTLARELMAKCGMPLAPSSGLIKNEEDLLESAKGIGFPVLIKPASGGGGIGMLPAYNEEQLPMVWQKAQSVATKAFGASDLYLERLVEKPRHIEFQVLADKHGCAKVIFERDCSVQRRNQKVIEEARAYNIDRNELSDISLKLETILSQLGYDVIGTVEMLYTEELGFMFLEMNTRLQVEHAITEEISGLDIVEAQIKLSEGYALNDILPENLEAHGHAIEVRVYAEDPVKFFPSPGKLERFEIDRGEGIRVETCYQTGDIVTPYYDPLIAKVISKADTRAQAIDLLIASLARTEVQGIKTNIPFAIKVLESDEFKIGQIDTSIANQILQKHK